MAARPGSVDGGGGGARTESCPCAGLRRPGPWGGPGEVLVSVQGEVTWDRDRFLPGRAKPTVDGHVDTSENEAKRGVNTGRGRSSRRRGAAERRAAEKRGHSLMRRGRYTSVLSSFS